jgi:two-component system sensor histidine kinase KdpD
VAILLAVVGVAVVTLLVALLEGPFGVPNAAAAYLLAVVAVAALIGTGAAVIAAIAAFFAYDFFFTAPYHAFTVADPGEWLNLVLLLVVGVVVGQLAGLQRQRAEAAVAREREATALFRISRALATSTDAREALPHVLGVLQKEVELVRAWVALGEDGDRPRIAADTGAETPPWTPTAYQLLQRKPKDQPAEWVRVHSPTRSAGGRPDGQLYRVKVQAGGRELGSIWSLRPRTSPTPSPPQTRLLSAAADQVGQALERDRLGVEATSAEIARRSDALKSALLDSVSHDLRTPLASIRAAAGSLMDPGTDWGPDDEYAAAAAIDREADRLNRLVTNLLDLSRIEAGGLKPQTGVFVLADLIDATMSRLHTQLSGRATSVHLPESLSPVRVDDVFLDQILTNLLENAVRYTPPSAPVRVSAAATDEASVSVTVEDGGPGVPPDAAAQLFDKFYRAPRPGEGARRGTGIGLTVVRGLAEAMGGSIEVRRSELGGLAFDLRLPSEHGDLAAASHDATSDSKRDASVAALAAPGLPAGARSTSDAPANTPAETPAEAGLLA